MIAIKKILFRGLLIIGILLGIFLWDRSPKVQREQFAQLLVTAITQNWETEEDVVIQLGALTPFGWERVYIFPPYATAEQIRGSLGFDWPKAMRIGIERRDDINLLVFVRDKKVVQYVAFPRVHGDFSELATPSGFSPGEAVFIVEKEGNGQPRFILRLAVPHESKAENGSED